ncbi:hypothetical protein HED60_11190 [Planctomycetales bacterium ZRK34]|nr:hypothetical protein HED60_11190 [Planctomycetales bacterium ZRK34]
MRRELAIFALMLITAPCAFAQSSAEVAALRAQLQQLRMELDRTRSQLVEAQQQINTLTDVASGGLSFEQWRTERSKIAAEQRALTREKIRVDQAREALTRTAAAESRKVEALQAHVDDDSQPLDKLPSRSTDHALGYGYTQQYGWPYAYDGAYIGYPGAYFSTGVYRPYGFGYYPYGYYRPYYYRPQRYRSSIRFGYDGDHVRFRFHSGSNRSHDHRSEVHLPDRDVTPTPRPTLPPTPIAPPVSAPRFELPSKPMRRAAETRPHPAFQLRLRDN